VEFFKQVSAKRGRGRMWEAIETMPYIMFTIGCVLMVDGLTGNWLGLFWGLVFMWFGAENAGLGCHLKALRAEHQELVAKLLKAREEG
jgi:hypothetical protein